MVDVLPGVLSVEQTRGAEGRRCGETFGMTAGLACAFAVLGLLGSYTDSSSIAAASNGLPVMTKWIARVVSCCVYASAVLFPAGVCGLVRTKGRLCVLGLTFLLGIALSFVGCASMPLFCAGQVAVGLSQPVVLLGWAHALTGMERQGRGRMVVLGGIGAALIVLVYKLSAPVPRAAIFAMAALGSLLLLPRHGKARCSPDIGANKGASRGEGLGASGIPWELLLLMACYAFLFRALQGFDFELPIVTPVVRCLVCVVALAFLGVYLGRRQDTRANLFSPLFMLVAVALALVPFSSPTLRAVANGIANSCWSLFYYILWLVLFDLGERLVRDSFRTFAVGWFGLNVCLIAVAPLVALLTAQIDQGTLSVTALVVMLIYTLLVASMLTRGASRRDSNPSSGVGSASEVIDPLVDSCMRLSGEAVLTPRESEVLVLLARGRSVPYISDELSISQSTVKGHVQHIYAKAGVANKQELLTLLER